jgi:hypothetical protein
MIKELVVDERKIQKSFIDQIKGKKQVQKKSIGVYKYLVHHSFFEVLTNAYPEFYKIIKEKKLDKEFDKSLFKFMQTKALSPYIWEMPNEYRKFLKKSKYFKELKYINNLLQLEYSELFIFMQKESKDKKHKFTLTKKYKVSKNITLNKYNYDVINKNFDKKENIYILGYFDKSSQEVAYRPLNNLLFSFLNSIDKTISLKVNLRLFLKKNKLSYKDYAKAFENVLEELFTQKVLV